MRNNRGFSLLEITIVLLIVGLLLAGVLGPLSTQIEQKKRQRAKEQLEDIREALFGFAITKGRLPCPDTDGSGSENYTGTPPNHSCINTIPNELPWKDLHVLEFDPWREHFIYRVVGTFADGSLNTNTFAPPAATCLTTPSLGVTFALCTEASIKVLSAKGVTPAVMDNIPAIVVSKGGHNLAADDSDDEKENYDNNNNFVSRTFSMTSDNEFDDLMIWISPNILKYRMVQAGRLP